MPCAYVRWNWGAPRVWSTHDALCVAVCCSVMQCVAVRCSALQCVAVCCSMLRSVAMCCSSVSSTIVLYSQSSHAVTFDILCFLRSVAGGKGRMRHNGVATPRVLNHSFHRIPVFIFHFSFFIFGLFHIHLIYFIHNGVATPGVLDHSFHRIPVFIFHSGFISCCLFHTDARDTTGKQRPMGHSNNMCTCF